MSNWKTIIYLVFILLALFGIKDIDAADNSFEEGVAEFKAENYEEALEFFEKARKQDPNSSVAAFYLGLVYKQMGDYREAVKNFREAINLIPSVKDAYTELIEMLYTLDELKEAKERIAKAEKESIKPAHIAFLKGLVLSKENNNKEALEAFKKAKEIDESIAQAANLQIAMTYAKERRFAEAREHLKAVISVAPTSDLAMFAKEYETAIARTLEMYKPWRFTIGIGYQYDSNVVSKPIASLGAGIDDISGKRDTSIFNAFRIDYMPIPGGPWFFNAQYSLYTNNYLHNFKYDILSQSVSLIPGYNFEKGAITLPLTYNHLWLNEREYMGMISVKPTLNIILFPGHLGQFSAGYGKRDMLKYNPGSDPDEDRDANVYSLAFGYIYPFSDGKGMFNLRYEYSSDDTDGRNWDNTGHRISASLLMPLISKVNLILSGDIFLQDYKNTHTISGVRGFPDTPTKRKDKIYTGIAGMTWEMLKGLNLNLQYSHTRADSNFPIYDYKRGLYIAGIEYTF